MKDEGCKVQGARLKGSEDGGAPGGRALPTPVGLAFRQRPISNLKAQMWLGLEAVASLTSADRSVRVTFS